MLVFLLRLAGSVTASAFLAIFLPVEWMASTHRWLGLGEFPRAPVVDYLARSIAALYGFHGACCSSSPEIPSGIGPSFPTWLS